MTLATLLARRVIAGFVTVWAVLTAVFAVFTFTDDWHLEQTIAVAGSSGGLSDREREAIRDTYFAGRDRDGTVTGRYIEYMVDTLTLQWGQSFETGENVLSTVLSATLTTGSYVVPALVIAVCLALGVGVYAAMRPATRREQAVRLAVYLGLGIPSFWVGVVLLVQSDAVPYSFTGTQDFIAPLDLPVHYGRALPILLVALTLVAAIASHARSHSLEYATSDAAKLVRAKGGRRADVARHVVKNAAIPLLSLTFTETLGLLAISVFVMEAVFGIEGIGLVFYNAIWAHDLPVVTGVTTAVVAIGVLGNVTQDLAYTLLDPRVDVGGR